MRTNAIGPNDKKALRKEVQLLRATGRLKIEGDVNRISPRDLLKHVLEVRNDPQVRFEYLDQLRRDYHKCETCKLRVQVLFLHSKQMVFLNTPVQEMTLDLLRILAAPHSDYLQKSRYDVDKLTPAFHRCTKECADAHRHLPNPMQAKYRSPKDGTETAQIPALFPSGEVTASQVEQHNVLYIDGKSTRTFFGLLNPPESTTPQVVLFIDFPNVDNMSQVAAQRIFRLARLLHMGAIYSPRCTANAAHQAVDPTLREHFKSLKHS